MKRFFLFVVMPYLVIAAAIWIIPNLEVPAIYFYASLAALLVCHQIVWCRSIITKKMVGEIVLKRVSKKIHYNYLGLALMYTVLYVTNPSHGHLFFPIAFGFLISIEFGNYFIIKSYKPEAIVINGQTLCVDFYYPINRDLSELACIKLNGLNNRAEMVFTKTNSLYFYGDEFEKDALKAFIHITTGKSRYDVSIAQNLQHYLNTEACIFTR